MHGEKDAVRVNFVVIDEDGPDRFGVLEDGLVFAGRLIGSLKPKVGKGMVIGRLGQEPATKGNPPWVLDDRDGRREGQGAGVPRVDRPGALTPPHRPPRE